MSETQESADSILVERLQEILDAVRILETVVEPFSKWPHINARAIRGSESSAAFDHNRMVDALIGSHRRAGRIRALLKRAIVCAKQATKEQP